MNISEIFSSIGHARSGTVSRQKPEWNNTRLVEERLERTGFYEGKGILRREKFFQGRFIISRDKPINGGVYLGGAEREAIVVDDQKDPYLNTVFEEVIRRRQLAQSQGKDFKDGLLETVWELVNEVMPYDVKRVIQIIKALLGPDKKIYLSSFIGGGICRHQALLTGYLLEKLAREGLIGGRVSIDRNFVPGKGGHAWVRYENSVGEVYILDSTLYYIGGLKDMSEGRWFYERPEDKSKLAKLRMNIGRFLMG